MHIIDTVVRDDEQLAPEDVVALSMRGFETLCLLQSASYQFRKYLLMVAKYPTDTLADYDGHLAMWISTLSDGAIEVLHAAVCNHITSSLRTLH